MGQREAFQKQKFGIGAFFKLVSEMSGRCYIILKFVMKF